MVFIASFIKYLIELIFLAAVAVCGIFAGKKLRDRKDAKLASEMAGSGSEEKSE